MSKKHPVTVSDKHSSFLDKARLLNRTKLFVVDDKAKLAENVKAEEFRVLVRQELDDANDEVAVAKLKAKFDENQMRYRKKQPSDVGRLGLRSGGFSNNFAGGDSSAAGPRLRGEDHYKQRTPIDATAREARRIMGSVQHYDEAFDKRARVSLDSRAAAILGGQAGGSYSEKHEGAERVAADDGPNFSSPLYHGFHANDDKDDNPSQHLSKVTEKLGFGAGADPINPSQAELRDTLDDVFGMSQPGAAKYTSLPPAGGAVQNNNDRYGYGERRYERESYDTDEVYYDALKPIPQNFTFDHMNRPKIKKNHASDFDERQGIALAESVIKEVRKNYSVTAVRSMYRRRKEAEQEDQRAAYRNMKKSMEADARAKEWKKSRVDDVRKKRTGTITEVARDDKAVHFVEKEKEKEKAAEEEKDGFFVMDHLTLKEMSTDPFYKSAKETDCRALLRRMTGVLLRSNVIENGGYAADAKLCLQMLATSLLGDIDGGIIPRAREIVREGVPTGNWEMLLEPKVERFGLKAELKKFEIRMPRHNFDDVENTRKNLMTAPC